MSFKVREAHWHILLEAMEASPVIATGKFVGPKGRELYKQLWDETAKKLNALGFGSKATDKWQKTWSDFKYNLKRKAASLKKNMNKTGGGISEEKDFSDLEMRILDILGENFIGLNEPECGVPSESTINSVTDSQVFTASLEFTPGINIKKRSINNQQPARKRQAVEYLQEYRETLNELSDIKTTLKTSLEEVSKELKEMTAEIRQLNYNLVQILQAQQNFLQNICNG